MTGQNNWTRPRVGYGYQRTMRVPGPIVPLPVARRSILSRLFRASAPAATNTSPRAGALGGEGV